MPKPSDEEALVRVRAAGICGSDIPRAFLTGAHKHPIIIGHEFSGEVVAVGSEEKADVEAPFSWVGKRVGIFPLIPCRECAPCKNKQYEMCRTYNYLGSRCDGGFAEYVKVPIANLIALPSNVTYEQAAMLEPMAVAVHALRKSGLLEEEQEKKPVAVIGLGTIGLLLAMFLKEAGYHNLLLVGNKEYQGDCLERLGVERECFCNERTQNANQWLLDRTKGNGASVIFECVGKNETITQAISCCAPAGRIVLVGNPYTDMEFSKDIYWKILRNQLTVKGSWNSSFTGETGDDWHYVLELLEKERIHPEVLISHRMSLEKIQEGMHIMRDKSEDYVKIMCIEESL